MVRKFMIALGVTALALTGTACKTVKGAGEDIKSVGEAGSDALGNP